MSRLFDALSSLRKHNGRTRDGVPVQDTTMDKNETEVNLHQLRYDLFGLLVPRDTRVNVMQQL